jgi:hypothetical protein
MPQGAVLTPCACHPEEPCFSGDEGCRQFACQIGDFAAGGNCIDAVRKLPWANCEDSSRHP